MAVLSLLYFFYQPVENSFHPKCILHSLTGLHCPGCGSQRAVHALLHGEVKSALGFNALMIAFIPLILYSAFVFCWNATRRKKITHKIFYSTAFVKGLLIVVVLFSVLRNLPYKPFNMLAP
ncbi:MAG: DUF2752 domain-containing protein [Gemmatimonadaceae bacterium]|nr:DUF2752 domain-containing protein [Chitinophagaceae bacterium]